LEIIKGSKYVEVMGMFNPFSVLNTLANKKKDYYWFETGTPTFLIQQLHDLHFDLQEFAKGVSVSIQALTNYRADGCILWNSPTKKSNTASLKI
jgi:hypothetical protein